MATAIVMRGAAEIFGFTFSYIDALPTQQKMNNLFWPDENSYEQCFAAHIVQGCQQYSSTLLQASSGSTTTCLILLTILNNVGSKILFNVVFIRPELVVHFWLCSVLVYI